MFEDAEFKSEELREYLVKATELLEDCEKDDCMDDYDAALFMNLTIMTATGDETATTQQAFAYIDSYFS